MSTADSFVAPINKPNIFMIGLSRGLPPGPLGLLGNLLARAGLSPPQMAHLAGRFFLYPACTSTPRGALMLRIPPAGVGSAGTSSTESSYWSGSVHATELLGFVLGPGAVVLGSFGFRTGRFIGLLLPTFHDPSVPRLVRSGRHF